MGNKTNLTVKQMQEKMRMEFCMKLPVKAIHISQQYSSLTKTYLIDIVVFKSFELVKAVLLRSKADYCRKFSEMEGSRSYKYSNNVSVCHNYLNS